MVAGNGYLIRLCQFVADTAGTIERVVGVDFINEPHDDIVLFSDHWLVVGASAGDIDELALTTEADGSLSVLQKEYFFMMGQGAIFFSTTRVRVPSDR